ncbi:Acetylserotonin O-methyltransferase [Sesamum angolense]|uniref:Acetylserotonin O-methyltransferase n=1 Tax=Sesamum angolense TaxID=2727404 RepID=A0AAE2C1K2_9LAMI|nr:Acetylserotonin O-methyltransferase [Sesamum angolense]
MKSGGNSIAALVLLESSHAVLAPWHRLSKSALISGASAFDAAHGEDLWQYAAANPSHSKLINDAMACCARVDISAVTNQYPEAFKGISPLVDVGGGDGTALQILVKACLWIHGINFDLTHAVSVAPQCQGIEHVQGNMFEIVPKADAAFLMDTGKVIIAEAVIDEGEEDKNMDVRLALDMVMLVHTEKGKERTIAEWEYVVNAAGFTRFTVKRIQATISVIEAYP